MSNPLLYSASIDTSIGATSGNDPLSSCTAMLEWYSETNSKIPGGSVFKIDSQMREDAYKLDPLLSGTIMPYKKNTLLAEGHLETDDNKKYEQGIKEIEAKHEELGTMDILRKIHDDYACIHGKAFIRCEPSLVELERLEKLDNKSIRVYKDPFDSRKKAYHQRVEVFKGWNTDEDTEEFNTWWIPDVPSGKVWVEGEGNIKDDGVKEIFDQFAKDYNIKDTKNLRIGSIEDLIVLDKEHAPIDSCLLAIWLKRLLLVQSPNAIYRILSPIIHMEVGKPVEIMVNGEKQIIPTAVPKPDPALASLDSEQYAADVKAYEEFKADIEAAIKNVATAIKKGSTFATAPGIEVKVIESAQAVTSEFIKDMIKINNDEIAQSVGFPMAIIDASGSELATSRVVKDTLNTSMQGEKRDFEKVFEIINKMLYEDTVWEYEVENEEGVIERGTYRYSDMNARWNLELPDNNDKHTEAQTLQVIIDAIVKLKELGLSKADMQAVIDENTDLGILSLDQYDAEPVGGSTEPVGSPTVVVQDDTGQEQGTQVTDPAVSAKVDEEEDLKETLLRAFEEQGAKGFRKQIEKLKR